MIEGKGSSVAQLFQGMKLERPEMRCGIHGGAKVTHIEESSFSALCPACVSDMQIEAKLLQPICEFFEKRQEKLDEVQG